jgi:prophage regulatory protein
MNWLTLKEVMKLTSLSKSSIYSLMAKNQFPAQIRITPRRVVWRQIEIFSWIESKS